VVERFDRASIRAKQLSEKVTSEEPAIGALINELAHCFPIDTNHLIGEAPSLITPTEQPQSPVARSVARPFTHDNQEQRPYSSPRQPISILRSPLARTPGASPPLRCIRTAEIDVETVEEKEEEKKEEEPAPPPVRQVPTIQEEIASYIALDFEQRNYDGLQPAWNPSSKPIKVVNQRQANGAMRAKIVWLADQLGYRAARLKQDKLAIAEAASRAVFYDCGCPAAPKGRKVAHWFDTIDQARRNLDDIDFGNVLETDRLGPRRGTYCERIEAAHPNYLRELYRRAGKNPKVTFRATFAELADEMNRLSRLEADRPQLFLSRQTLKSWFHSSGGKVRKGWERPILTPERMAARVQ